MKKLIIHIGYPKTATTSLQLNLFAALHKTGKIEYLNHVNRLDNNLGLGNIYCAKTLNYIYGTNLKSNYQNEIEEIKKINKTITLISSENISFFCENFSWAFLNSKAEDNIKRIKEVFGSIFDIIEIIITIRAQETMIPSFYAQQYHLIKGVEASFIDFRKWINANFGSHIKNDNLIFNYNLMYEKYCDIFGPEKVHLLLFEDLKYDRINFYTKLSLLFNVQIKFIQSCLDVNTQNKTEKIDKNNLIAEKPNLELVITNYLRKILSLFFSKNTIKKGGKYYRRYLPQKLLTAKLNILVKIRNLNIEEKDLIHDRFDKLNLELAKKANLDINKIRDYKYV